MKLEIIKKILGIAILAISISQGIWIMMLWKLVDEYLCTFINAWPNRRLIGYGPGRQYLDLLPTAAISAVMGVMVWRIEALALGTVTTLLLQIIAGVVVYAVLSWLFNRECLIYLFKTCREGMITNKDIIITPCSCIKISNCKSKSCKAFDSTKNK